MALGDKAKALASHNITADLGDKSPKEIDDKLLSLQNALGDFVDLAKFMESDSDNEEYNSLSEKYSNPSIESKEIEEAVPNDVEQEQEKQKEVQVDEAVAVKDEITTLTVESKVHGVDLEGVQSKKAPVPDKEVVSDGEAHTLNIEVDEVKETIETEENHAEEPEIKTISNDEPLEVEEPKIEFVWNYTIHFVDESGKEIRDPERGSKVAFGKYDPIIDKIIYEPSVLQIMNVIPEIKGYDSIQKTAIFEKIPEQSKSSSSDNFTLYYIQSKEKEKSSTYSSSTNRNNDLETPQERVYIKNDTAINEDELQDSVTKAILAMQHSDYAYTINIESIKSEAYQKNLYSVLNKAKVSSEGDIKTIPEIEKWEEIFSTRLLKDINYLRDLLGLQGIEFIGNDKARVATYKKFSSISGETQTFKGTELSIELLADKAAEFMMLKMLTGDSRDRKLLKSKKISIGFFPAEVRSMEGFIPDGNLLIYAKNIILEE